MDEPIMSFTECWGNDKAICPYCGYMDEDSWEHEEGETETECPACGREYLVEVEIVTKYTTTPKEGWSD